MIVKQELDTLIIDSEFPGGTVSHWLNAFPSKDLMASVNRCSIVLIATLSLIPLRSKA
jgi:hypothetical protein